MLESPSLSVSAVLPPCGHILILGFLELRPGTYQQIPLYLLFGAGVVMELDMAGLAFEPKSLSMHAFASVTPLSGMFFCSFVDFGSCLFLQDAALPCHMSLNAGKLQSCL